MTGTSVENLSVRRPAVGQYLNQASLLRDAGVRTTSAAGVLEIWLRAAARALPGAA